jgi:long-subunit fatty acid transport protein
VVYEVSPAVSYAPIKELSFGIGYRITIIQFDRHLGPASNPVLVDINSFGENFTGFRFGAQWHPLKQLSFGAVFRPEVQITSNADKGHILGQAATNIQAQLNYPAKVGAGVRIDLDPVSFAVDYEFVANSQFKTISLDGNLPHGAIHASFLFNWSDSSTIKVGVEYRIIPKVALRVGYAWDGSFENRAYPDTYMQPPVAGDYLTLGAGYRGASWALNVALSYRPDESAVIAANQVASAAECPLCAKPGTYGSRLNMALVDFSKDFDL